MITNILAYLEQTAREAPHNTAFADKDTSLSFTELQNLSKRAGSFLLRFNLKNAAIAVMVEKTPLSIAAFLGCAYSGNLYAPIDAAMPKERAQSILQTLAPSVLITDEKSAKTAEALGFPGTTVLLADMLTADIDEPALALIRARSIDTDPLYVIFTSGSTGVPKGVVITHQAVVNLTEWYTTALRIDRDEVIGNQAPFYFDSSVKDIYAVLKTGARMEIVPTALFSFPIRLMEYVRDKAITYIDWVPSALTIIANTGALEACTLPALRKLAFVGEIMPTKQFNQWRRTYPNLLYANIYGPTEATVDSVYYIIDREFADDELLPIGRACENTDVFLLANGKEAAPGEVGELCIRGRCLAPGYYNNPEKTAEAFIQNPLNPHYPERIYKTGDMARLNEHGEIVFLARQDSQIKHMGHRIELGEIEAAVNSIEGLDAGACLYDADTQRIVLFYCGADITPAFILKRLRDKVPKYMFPNLMLPLEAMPRTPNGKTDKRKLKSFLETYYAERNEN